MWKTIGLNMKDSFQKTARTEKASCTYQTDKYSKVISRMIWYGEKESWADEMEVESRDSGDKINWSVSIDYFHYQKNNNQNQAKTFLRILKPSTFWKPSFFTVYVPFILILLFSFWRGSFFLLNLAPFSMRLERVSLIPRVRLKFETRGSPSASRLFSLGWRGWMQASIFFFSSGKVLYFDLLGI